MTDESYITSRVREIEAFERRARGKIPSKPKMATSKQVTPKQVLFQNNGANTMLTETIQETRPQVPHRTPLPPLPVINHMPVPASVPAPTSLLDIILHAGGDPNFDVEKFRTLVAIQREEQDRQDARAEREAELSAEAAFNAAMTDVQRQMGRVATDAVNTSTRSRYASYGALDRAIRPLYTAAGFNISFNEAVGTVGADMVRALAYVTHAVPGAKRSHTRTYHTDIPADGKGAKGGEVMNRTHAHVSATSYGKRVLLGMIFNIATGNDDDGNAAAGKIADATPLPDTISSIQANEIRAMLDERGISHRAFLHHVRLSRIEDIGIAHFERAKGVIKKFGGRS